MKLGNTTTVTGAAERGTKALDMGDYTAENGGAGTAMEDTTHATTVPAATSTTAENGNGGTGTGKDEGGPCGLPFKCDIM